MQPGAPYAPNDPMMQMRLRAAQMANDPQALLKLAQQADPNALVPPQGVPQDPSAQAGLNPYYAADAPPDPASPVNPATPNIGQLLMATTNMAGSRPPMPPVVNPGAAPHLGAAALAPRPVQAPLPQQQPYALGRLLLGR